MRVAFHVRWLLLGTAEHLRGLHDMLQLQCRIIQMGARGKVAQGGSTEGDTCPQL